MGHGVSRVQPSAHESSTGAGMRWVSLGLAVSMMATDLAAVSRMQMNAPAKEKYENNWSSTRVNRPEVRWGLA